MPEVEEGLLRREPCTRFEDFLPAVVADALELELADGLVYERVELGELTAQWRGRRPLGDVYFGPMQRRDGWSTATCVTDALAFFESAGFVEWLGRLAGEELEFLRPVTAYRLERGDRICLHDDMSDPDHAVSVAYNLSRDWTSVDGGCTIFGSVTGITPLPTPVDSPIPLQRWEITDEEVFVPSFNSLLVMKLGQEFAHGVDEVTGSRPRLSLVGIYGRR
ncbi:2OG-Fe(II) oxygenase [Lentzea sp. NBRC 105346]|uniref:2OG-Fe(II) oxygenase n=1 Tax=Lentzea sp. NBRC 105346 TaxID=3032205 RepID=UPI002555882E|nr:2OG-Fe(II) oxygenase [Lentzea sp. NBRC 105346]